MKPRLPPLRGSRFFSAALDLLYPPTCEQCQEPLEDNRWLCESCAMALPRVEPPFCDTCGEPFSGNIETAFSCPNCRGLDLAFDFARAALDGDAESTRSLVHALKYQRRIHLGRDLAELIAEVFADPRLERAVAEQWPLVPIPLHPSRQRQRHFNQAAELASHLGKFLDLPVVSALRRVRATSTQTALSRKKRLANLSGAFALSRAGRSLRAGPVILIDDVLTTGATSHECAKVLKNHGVSRVAVVTLARS